MYRRRRLLGSKTPRIFLDNGASGETRSPEEAVSTRRSCRLRVEFAIASENTGSRDLAENIRRSFGREPHNEIIGQPRSAAGANGMIIRHGYIVAEWGDTSRVDMTFSVTKSFLSTVFAIAQADGDIRSTDDLVKDYVRDGSFDGEHNSQITWEHLLQQTSDWSGELWGKPDWADRPRGRDPNAWPNRELRTPGTSYKYNDVRVNLLAHCLLKVLQRPLPVVLKERVMDKIGASPTWRWHGYEKLLCHRQRPNDAVRFRRRALGRGNVHLHARPGSLRVSFSARRSLG